jgi:cell wall-associated NlpC family hydrolase
MNHVGIYVGNNDFIHAPTTGDVVKKCSLTSNYWQKAYKFARRYY